MVCSPGAVSNYPSKKEEKASTAPRCCCGVAFFSLNFLCSQWPPPKHTATV